RVRLSGRPRLRNRRQPQLATFAGPSWHGRLHPPHAARLRAAHCRHRSHRAMDPRRSQTMMRRALAACIAIVVFWLLPRAAEAYLRGEIPNTGLSAYVAAGYRGTVRTPGSNHTGTFEGFISREHYLMWRTGIAGATPYVRVGRFYAPYGLRVVEHIDYIRRY